MITAVTCTGDRPVCFSLLEQWVKDQTVKPDQWIVVDDGQEPVVESDSYELIRREPKKEDPRFTMLLNLELAFQQVKGDQILFLEDDEYYAPGYIEAMSKELSQYELVGIGRSKYYHLPARKWFRHFNMGHASLAQTGFKSSFLPQALKCLKGDMFYDIRLWQMVNKDAEKFRAPAQVDRHYSEDGRGLVFEDKNHSLYVGMKGLPGRAGIGSGHREFAWYFQDLNMKMLSDWIPNSSHYRKYMSLTEKQNKVTLTVQRRKWR